MKMPHGITLLVATLFLFSCKAETEAGLEGETQTTVDTMKIIFRYEHGIAKGILYDNATAKAFAKLLPMTITLEDYHKTEKIAVLESRLNTVQAPAGFDPSIGDITYYAPWGNLAIFYKDFGYSTGLVSLGKITEGLDFLTGSEGSKLTIELED